MAEMKERALVLTQGDALRMIVEQAQEGPNAHRHDGETCVYISKENFELLRLIADNAAKQESPQSEVGQESFPFPKSPEEAEE